LVNKKSVKQGGCIQIRSVYISSGCEVYIWVEQKGKLLSYYRN